MTDTGTTTSRKMTLTDAVNSMWAKTTGGVTILNDQGLKYKRGQLASHAEVKDRSIYSKSKKKRTKSKIKEFKYPFPSRCKHRT